LRRYGVGIGPLHPLILVRRTEKVRASNALRVEGGACSQVSEHNRVRRL
jgi:hypothetical protein